MIDNIEYGRERLRDTIEEEARLEGRSLQKLCNKWTPKTDMDSYFVRAKPHTKAFTEAQLKEMQSTKKVMTSWVKWKNSGKSVLTLDTRDFECVQDIGNKTGDNCTKVEIPFNSLMIEFFEGRNIEKRMFDTTYV